MIIFLVCEVPWLVGSPEARTEFAFFLALYRGYVYAVGCRTCSLLLEVSLSYFICLVWRDWWFFCITIFLSFLVLRRMCQSSPGEKEKAFFPPLSLKALAATKAESRLAGLREQLAKLVTWFLYQWTVYQRCAVFFTLSLSELEGEVSVPGKKK